MSHILDTGPIFKFLVTDCVPHLFAALKTNPVCAPEAVQFEVLDSPRRHQQFEKAPEAWEHRVPERLKRILSDEATVEMRKLSQEVYQVDFDDLYAEKRDLGERMAVLHAVRLARSGESVLVVCDDEGGIADLEKQSRLLRMQHMHGLHAPGGSIRHAGTETILRWAIEAGAFTTRTEFTTKYQAMVALDEALPRDLVSTGLLKSPPWPPGSC